MDIAARLRKILGERLKENEVLKPYTLLKIGGVADFFYEARTIEELIQAVSAACSFNLPYLVLGGGSQILISDYGSPGLVIRNLTSTISFVLPHSQVIVDSGVNTARLVMEAASRELGGMEFLATVPGTIGGAVYGNQGNFGFAIGAYLRSVTILWPPDKIKTYKVDWLQPEYLTTRAKKLRLQHRCPPVILSARLQLQHYKKEEIVRKIAYYQKLAAMADNKNELISLPVFKNPNGQPLRPSDDPDVIDRSAREVLRRLDIKKLHFGAVWTFSEDPSRLLNRGNGRATDARTLIDKLIELAAETQGVRLEEAWEYVGKWE